MCFNYDLRKALKKSFQTVCQYQTTPCWWDRSRGDLGIEWPKMTIRGTNTHVFAVGDWGGLAGTLPHNSQIIQYKGGDQVFVGWKGLLFAPQVFLGERCTKTI